MIRAVRAVSPFLMRSLSRCFAHRRAVVCLGHGIEATIHIGGGERIQNFERVNAAKSTKTPKRND